MTNHVTQLESFVNFGINRDSRSNFQPRPSADRKLTLLVPLQVENTDNSTSIWVKHWSHIIWLFPLNLSNWGLFHPYLRSSLAACFQPRAPANGGFWLADWATRRSCDLSSYSSGCLPIGQAYTTLERPISALGNSATLWILARSCPFFQK